MNFQTAIRTCLGRYAAISGRAAISEYWWFLLFAGLVNTAAALGDGLVFGFAAPGEAGTHLLGPVAGLAVAIPLLAAGWRRMHDTGRPGWLILLPSLVTLAALAFLLVGIAGFGLIEQLMADPGRLRGIAAVLGSTGLTVASLAVLAAIAAKLWWLTRPGDPEDNRFGPPVGSPTPIT